jgi:hypothetical protein
MKLFSTENVPEDTLSDFPWFSHFIFTTNSVLSSFCKCRNRSLERERNWSQVAAGGREQGLQLRAIRVQKLCCL